MSKALGARKAFEIINDFRTQAATGAGLNLAKAAEALARSGDEAQAMGLLKRASSYKKFSGDMDSVEASALKSLMEDYTGPAMTVEKYNKAGQAAVKQPLILDSTNFPQRMSDMDFVPLTNVDINKPSVTMKQFQGKDKDRFIDEGAQNLIAAWNLSPADAKKFSSFYRRLNKEAGSTNIPLDRMAGNIAVTSAGRDPELNLRLANAIAKDPRGLVTSVEDQILALDYLAGRVADDAAELGVGKRYNFKGNIVNPDDPTMLTADTRYAQNLQGIPNTYSRAAFKGLFDPKSSSNRYGNIYTQPGMEAARRMNMLPSELQAGTWGNWRKYLFGIEDDLPTGLLSDVQNMPYNPMMYQDAASYWRSIGNNLEKMNPEMRENVLSSLKGTF
jgi:hypothetical protein